MTDDPNSVTDTLVLGAIAAAIEAWHDAWAGENYEFVDIAKVVSRDLAAAGFEVVPAGTTEQLANYKANYTHMCGELFHLTAERDDLLVRLSALTAAIDKLIGWAESYRMHHVVIALRDALAAAVSPTPTPDNEEPPTAEALDEVVSLSDELGMYDNDPPPAERCPTCGSDSRTMLISEGPVGCWTRNHHPWHDR